MHRLPTLRSLAALAALSLAACEDSTAPGTSASVQLAAPAVAGASAETPTGLSIAGTNGTLLITDMRLVVDEFELKRAGVAGCDDDLVGGDDDDCEEFESNLFVADVPLGSGTVTVANDRIPAGAYTAMEFEVKDLFVDDGDDDDMLRAARIAELLTQLRQTYADWPAGASMMIAGTFTPTGGAPQPFRVYFDADVEVETTFSPALTIDGGSQGVTIELRPDLWFKRLDGTVRNLAAWNYATTSSLVEFEVEIEGGLEGGIEIEHD